MSYFDLMKEELKIRAKRDEREIKAIVDEARRRRDQKFKLDHGQTPEEYVDEYIAREKTDLVMEREINYPNEPSRHRITPQEGAYFKGFKAGFLGKPRACPYPDYREGYSDSVSWSRGFIRAWERGYREGKRFREIVEAPRPKEVENGF